MSYVILDLEWNSTKVNKSKPYLNEIFQFGAIKVDENLEVIDTFEALIKPQMSREFNPYVKNLTKVSFEELENAPYVFETALDEFADFLGDSVLLTWSSSDILALIDNKKFFMYSSRLYFIKKFCDLQSYCEYRLGMENTTRHLGLSACAELLEITVGDGLHSALYDAKLSLECLRKTYDKDILNAFTEDASKNEFYKKLTFKSRCITSLKDPMINKKMLYFDCPECKVRCVQKSRWNREKHRFTAYFLCPKCKKQFTGEVRVKQKYEGIVVKKTIL